METPGWGQLRRGWRCWWGLGEVQSWGALCHCLPLPWCQQQHPFSSPHARCDVLEQPCALGGVPPESGTCVHPRRRQHPRRPAALASCVPGARRATRPAMSPAGTSAHLQDASATALPHSPAPQPCPCPADNGPQPPSPCPTAPRCRQDHNPLSHSPHLPNPTAPRHSQAHNPWPHRASRITALHPTAQPCSPQHCRRLSRPMAPVSTPHHGRRRCGRCHRR